MGLAEQYLKRLGRNLDDVAASEWGAVTRAADLIAEALRTGHQAHVYPAGHLMPYEAAADRPGLPDLLPPLADTEIDRLEPGDVLVMTHQYGVLEQYVDVATRAKACGARIIAIAARSDPEAIVRTHPSGTWVGDYAEVLIDTRIPEGDTALVAPTGGPGACPTSGVVQAAFHWSLVCAVAERLGRRSPPHGR